MSDQFWLTEQQFARFEAFLPRDTRGVPRVDDRRVISGIVHALCDGHGRPLTFLLTGGNAADAPQARTLLQALPEGAIVLVDKAYNADAIRRFIESRSAVANIRSRKIVAGKSASAPSSIATATSSSVCSAASRTFAGSPRDTTNSRQTSSLPFRSQPSSPTGYES